jgi:hypothetical protein
VGAFSNPKIRHDDHGDLATKITMITKVSGFVFFVSFVAFPFAILVAWRGRVFQPPKIRHNDHEDFATKIPMITKVSGLQDHDDHEGLSASCSSCPSWLKFFVSSWPCAASPVDNVEATPCKEATHTF